MGHVSCARYMGHMSCARHMSHVSSILGMANMVKTIQKHYAGALTCQ
jgi:hypothetical protein